ncbi:MAG: hypothetical protein QXU90_04920, partial [Acidilobaceae archaeon]
SLKGIESSRSVNVQELCDRNSLKGIERPIECKPKLINLYARRNSLKGIESPTIFGEPSL